MDDEIKTRKKVEEFFDWICWNHSIWMPLQLNHNKRAKEKQPTNARGAVSAAFVLVCSLRWVCCGAAQCFLFWWVKGGCKPQATSQERRQAGCIGLWALFALLSPWAAVQQLIHLWIDWWMERREESKQSERAPRPRGRSKPTTNHKTNQIKN